MKIDSGILKARQEMPLEAKINLSLQRIKSWYDHYQGNVYVAFSGGKDSTVLLNLVRDYYPHVPAVFVDTGLEYPEIREFVKSIDNVIWLKPKMNFKKVIENYGYPVISKMQSQYIDYVMNCDKDCKTKEIRLNGTDKYTSEEKTENTLFGEQKIKTKGSKQYMISDQWKFLIDSPFKISDKCCSVMKKQPFHDYEKESQRKPYIGIMASESIQRKKQYIQNGCNAFDMKNPQSRPMMFWTEKDVWDYIKQRKLNYSKIYDMDGIYRTGCIFCAYGVHLEKRPHRYDVLKKTHPKLWSYCMDKLGFRKVLEYMGVDIENYYEKELFENK